MTSNGRTSLTHEVDVRLPTVAGDFRMHLYEDEDGKQHLALVMGDIYGKEDVLTRIHSECLTGDLFGSLRCDCQSQLQQSIEMIVEEGTGIVVYLRQEGRGIGLLSKLHTYNLQDEGLDTIDANTALGYQPDAREYDAAFLILKDQGVRSIRLLTNNPDKTSSFEKFGITVSSMMPIRPRVTKDNQRYLQTKVERCNHLIDIKESSYHSPEIDRLLRFASRAMGREDVTSPFLTLLYSQTLNGQITGTQFTPPPEISTELAAMRERLRRLHRAVLIDAAWSPVELNGEDTASLLVVYDKGLQVVGRMDLAKMPKKLLVLTDKDADEDQIGKLRGAGVDLVLVPQEDLQRSLLAALRDRGVSTAIVEGSPQLLRSTLFSDHVGMVVGLVSPCITSEKAAVEEGGIHLDRSLQFEDIDYVEIGTSLVYYGTPLRMGR